MRLTRLEIVVDDLVVRAEFELEDGERTTARFSVTERDGLMLAVPDPPGIFDGTDLDAPQVRQIINAVVQFARAHRRMGS